MKKQNCEGVCILDEEDQGIDSFDDGVTTEEVDEAIRKFEEIVNNGSKTGNNYLSYHASKHIEGPVTYSLYYNGCQLGYGFDLDTLHEIVQCMTRKEQIDRNLEQGGRK